MTDKNKKERRNSHMTVTVKKEAWEVEVGDHVIYEGERGVVIDLEVHPDPDIYGPAQPDRITFVLEFGDNTCDEVTRWEYDELEVESRSIT
jgi:hypothetical protein